MNQDQNNINIGDNNVQSSGSGMNFVTGDASLTQQNAGVQPAMQHSDLMNTNVTNQNTEIAPQSIVTQPVVNELNVSQPVADTNNSAHQQSMQPIIQNTSVNIQQPVTAPSDVLPTQEQPILNQPVDNIKPVQNINGLDTLSSVQPVGTMNSVSDTVSSDLDEEPEPKKSNKLVILLVIVILTVIGVALGIFLFNKFGNKNNSASEEPVVEENTAVSLNANVINNTGVDNEKLMEVLNIVGIASTGDVANNNNLNYYISNANYKDNANNIILYYAVNLEGKTSSDITFPEEYDLKNDVGACSEAVNCALISKEDAEKILKLYNLGDDLSKYFYKSSEIEDVYGIHYDSSLNLSIFNGTDVGIIHNLTAELANENDINISDTQTINYYDEDGAVKTDNKSVVYNFKVNEDGSYYLDNVSINEE